jgi:Ser/Thr protein kinase RdoA (MazF antagonist)
MARNAGAMLGRFHKIMEDLEHDFKTDVILHETENEYKKLIEAARLEPELLKGMQVEFDFLMTELPKLFLPTDLAKRPTHGDPKINNFLFDGFGNALAMIDLDTCNRTSVLCDLGDAMRSWCGSKKEIDAGCFKTDIYEAALEGYMLEAKFLSDEEKSLIPQAVGLITLELAARYLADYFNDSYFGWNKELYASRREHNKIRVKRLISQYRDMREKMSL